MTIEALATQVGGSHYKDLKIQPAELVLQTNLDGISHSIIKYISRHRSKNGRADIEKALHFVEILGQGMEGGFKPVRGDKRESMRDAMQRYADENFERGSLEGAAITDLARAICHSRSHYMATGSLADLKTNLLAIILRDYGLAQT